MEKQGHLINGQSYTESEFLPTTLERRITASKQSIEQKNNKLGRYQNIDQNWKKKLRTTMLKTLKYSLLVFFQFFKYTSVYIFIISRFLLSRRTMNPKNSIRIQ